MTNKDYEVGFGRTPKHSRWKKGQSGNPKGRPKGHKNMSTIVEDVLNRTVTITENGKSRKVKYREAFVHKMAAKALNGSTRDQIAMLKAIHDYVPEALQETMKEALITVRLIEPGDVTPPADAESERSIKPWDVDQDAWADD